MLHSAAHHLEYAEQLALGIAVPNLIVSDRIKLADIHINLAQTMILARDFAIQNDTWADAQALERALPDAGRSAEAIDVQALSGGSAPTPRDVRPPAAGRGRAAVVAALDRLNDSGGVQDPRAWDWADVTLVVRNALRNLEAERAER